MNAMFYGRVATIKNLTELFSIYCIYIDNAIHLKL